MKNVRLVKPFYDTKANIQEISISDPYIASRASKPVEHEVVAVGKMAEIEIRMRNRELRMTYNTK